MTDISAHAYPARYAELCGTHDLVGWGNYIDLRDAILQRVFGFMVRAAAPVVKEYHGDLFIDAEWLRTWLDATLGNPDVSPGGFGSVNFDYCVRSSGTNANQTAALMFNGLAYDAALYHFTLRSDERGRWMLDIDLMSARPDRPVKD